MLNEHRRFQPLMLDGCVNADVAERQAWFGQEIPDQPGSSAPESAESWTAKVETRQASSTSAGQSPRAASKTPVEMPIGWWAASAWHVASAVVVATELRYLAPPTTSVRQSRKRIRDGCQSNRS